MRSLRAASILAVVVALAGAANASGKDYYECTGTIASNFNGTAIPQGDYIWFTGALTVKGLPSGPTTVYVSHAQVAFTADGKNYKIAVPSSVITFSSATSVATTDYTQLYPTFLGKGWSTQLPSSGLAGNDLMTAVEFKVPSGGLTGGIQNVSFTATFSSYAGGLTVNWQWAAAAYTSFSTNYNDLGVKPVDDNKASQYQNSDHAGTPENYKDFVTGGAMGGGGSNYTGSLSGTASCALTEEGSDSFTVSKPR